MRARERKSIRLLGFTPESWAEFRTWQDKRYSEVHGHTDDTGEWLDKETFEAHANCRCRINVLKPNLTIV